MTKTRKLGFASLLQAIDQRDGGWLAAQPTEISNEFTPLTTMRMASCGIRGREAAHTLLRLNQRVNYRLFDLSKHPDLCFRLLASCGLKRYQQRQWLPQRSTSNSNLALKLLAEHHPMANESEICILLSLYTRETFTEFVTDCGLKKEQTEYLKAYDKLQRT